MRLSELNRPRGWWCPLSLLRHRLMDLLPVERSPQYLMLPAPATLTFYEGDAAAAAALLRAQVKRRRYLLDEAAREDGSALPSKQPRSQSWCCPHRRVIHATPPAVLSLR